MIEQEINPTTQEHDKLANQLMLDMGFEWDTEKSHWNIPFNFLVQGEVTTAVKKLLASVTAQEPQTT